MFHKYKHLEINRFLGIFMAYLSLFMVNVLEYYDKVSSICSYWRGRGVWAELEREGKVKLTLSNWNETWVEISRNHIAFFQRPMAYKCYQQVVMCKEYGLKIWVDLDDWMEVPKEHPVYKEYNKLFKLSYFKRILDLADIITVTNEAMKIAYSEYCDRSKISVIPNAINDRIYSLKKASENKIIIWRGGENHVYDIKPYISQIKEVLELFPDWMFISIGYDIPELKGLKNYGHVKELSVHDYFGFIRNLNPSIVIVPLKRNKFNELKSNIAWQEATMCGAVSLIPEWANSNTGFNYTDENDFKQMFCEAILNKESRCDLHRKSTLILINSFTLYRINLLREELL